MNNELTPRQLDALDRIEKKPALQSFFFQKLKGLQWFDELEQRGFFSPDRHSPPTLVHAGRNRLLLLGYDFFSTSHHTLSRAGLSLPITDASRTDSSRVRARNTGYTRVR